MNHSKAADKDFGAKFAELEAIANWFESENIDLDEGLAKFEQGLALAADLRTYLETAQNKVEKIRAKFDAPVAAVETVEEPMPERATPPGPADLNLFAD